MIPRWASLLWALHFAILGTELDLHRRLEDWAWGIFSASHRLHGPLGMLRDIGGDGGGGGSRWPRVAARFFLGGGGFQSTKMWKPYETIRNYEAILLCQLWIRIVFFGYPELSSWHGCLKQQTSNRSKGEENYVLLWGQNRWLAARKKCRERLGHEFDSTNANT